MIMFLIYQLMIRYKNVEIKLYFHHRFTLRYVRADFETNLLPNITFLLVGS